MDLVSIVSTLAGDDGLHSLQLINVFRILERGDILADIRPPAAHVGSGEEHRIDKIEILFVVHAAHKYRTDHPAPAYKTNSHHIPAPFKVISEFYYTQRTGIFSCPDQR